MDPTFEQKVVALVETTDAAMTKAAEELEAANKRIEELEAQHAKVAEHIPAAVQACIDFQRVDESDRQHLSTILSDPAKAIGFIQKLAAHENAEELSALGRAHPGRGKTAAESSGRIERESARIWEAGFGTTR